MLDNRKNVFWQALLSAILIFGIGIFLGVAFEQSRNNSVEEILLGSEVNVLDSQLLANIGNNFNLSCEVGIEKVVEFADEIYGEANQLEDYDENSQFTDVLEILHKRYDLLRLLLWQQAINLKEKCAGEYHTVVYFYQFKDPDLKLRSEQIAFSRALEDLKEEYGSRIILIPIAGDLELNSINAVKSSYGIDEYPVVVVDERVVIRSLEELRSIRGKL